MPPTNRLIRPFATIILAAILSAGCASVPKEVVELSYAMGQDLDAVHRSYIALIHDRFERFRAERLRYFNERWKPTFVEAWIRDGRLTDIANGQVVWSGAEKKFVAPSGSQQKDQLLHSVQLWAVTAINGLDKKKRELMDPLDADEKSMIASVDDAFLRLSSANAAITAHLNSLRKVQEVQDEALQALKVKEIRDKLDQLIVTTSQNAQKGLEDVKTADQLLDKAQEEIQSLKK
ncbi:MAG: hypothetical protein NTY77_06000 [Elusimicrobia bacterium]|nr:hypothetical protein [Elusimicrobiota bacterium]